MDVKLINRLIESGIAQHLAFAVDEGKISELEAHVEQSLSNRSDEIRELPDHKWPSLDVIWDLAPADFYRSMDDGTAASFASDYPDVLIAKASIEDLYDNFLSGSKQVYDPFHESYRSKSARLLAFLETNKGVTPPLILYKNSRIFIAGGNHRFNWARHRQQNEIPILILKKDFVKIQQLLPNLLPPQS